MRKVKEIRESLSKGVKVCEETPGWYRWWCEKESASKLLNPLNVNISQLLHQNIDGKDYVAIYFGISKKGKGLNGRLKWHICQPHRQSAVESGTLSTFRQSLSALLGIKMVDAEKIVNSFIDECYVEFHNVPDSKEAEAMESQELTHKDYLYPINIKDAKGTPKEIRSNLKALRKLYKW